MSALEEDAPPPADVVDVWIAEAQAALTVRAAWHRAGIEATTYRRRAQDSLRLGQIDLAREWASKAAACFKAEAVLEAVEKHYDAVRALIVQREREEQQRALIEQEDEKRKAANRKKWADKRRQQKAG